jgi:hypothetical protein
MPTLLLSALSTYKFMPTVLVSSLSARHQQKVQANSSHGVVKINDAGKKKKKKGKNFDPEASSAAAVTSGDREEAALAEEPRGSVPFSSFTCRVLRACATLYEFSYSSFNVSQSSICP